MEALGISPAFGGISVHDGRLRYRAFGCEHALCNAHHLRELIYIEEAYQQAWAGQMKALLLKMKAWVQAARTRGASQLDPLSLLALSADYDRLIALGWQANAPPEGAPPRPRRGKQPPACNLLNRLQAGKLHVLAFLYNFAVPFDNNQAERDLRMRYPSNKRSRGACEARQASSRCAASAATCPRSASRELICCMPCTRPSWETLFSLLFSSPSE
jgi:transposase